ncbi:hypothetical protein HPB52_024442 [Rhipicephalus sanguineus]|uniref:Uncharacterized protein n=1 Tax=Rhipicephalus sanguineus TaxID=34632 RepID=A0A9D4YR89_RHISA|nr:hypothetical protein HPB52_024442 [Rhipicephalus sanguineus]
MDIADHFTTKPAVKRLSCCSIGVPALVFSLTTTDRLLFDTKCKDCTPQGSVTHWLSLHGRRPPPYIDPSGSDFVLCLLALHAVPRAILAGVVTRCLHNMFQVGPPWRWLYLILVFVNLVVDTQVTVSLSGITQLLNPEVPYYHSYIEFVGFSLFSMVVTCVMLKMSGQRMGYVVFRKADNSERPAQSAAHILCLLSQYGFLLCKLRFDVAFFRIIMDLLE